MKRAIVVASVASVLAMLAACKHGGEQTCHDLDSKGESTGCWCSRAVCIKTKSGDLAVQVDRCSPAAVETGTCLNPGPHESKT